MSLETAQTEIIRLHDFFTAWYQGAIPQSDLPQFTDVLHPEFQLVMPAGKLYTRAEVIEVIQSGHGQNPDFEITIEETHLIGTWPGATMAHYIERQTGARNSATTNRRRSTVLFDTGSPRLLWRHLQETWVS